MWNPIRKTIRQRTLPEFRRFQKVKHWPVTCHLLRARRNPLLNQSVNTNVPNSQFEESIKYEWYIFFSQLVSSCNSSNPAIWLVSQAGEIILFGSPQRVDLFSWTNNRGSTIFYLFRTPIDEKLTQVIPYSLLNGKESRWIEVNSVECFEVVRACLCCSSAL